MSPEHLSYICKVAAESNRREEDSPDSLTVTQSKRGELKRGEAKREGEKVVRV